MKYGFTFFVFLIILLMLSLGGIWTFYHYSTNASISVGKKIDSLNGVYVYYNGPIGNVTGRNTTPDGYNLGLKYQCVEFVKRYYYEYLKHKMPDPYGHAKDFFDTSLSDGEKSKKRALRQHRNPGKAIPKINDLLIFDGTSFNEYGHVAIISKVSNHEIEIIQQNAGPSGKSRETFPLVYKKGKWHIDHNRILGWLRKE